jgi:WD40 repeat protein
MITDAKLSADCSRIVFTDEAGALRLYDRATSTVLFDKPDAHSLMGQPVNAWCCEFLDDNLVASGGDDNLLKLWDIRVNEPVLISKGHDGGVVRLRMVDDQIWTGSYDEMLRIFDKRELSESIECVKVCYFLKMILYHLVPFS